LLSFIDGLSLSIAAAPFVYSVLRVSLLAIAPELDPTAMVWTERSATLDRLSLTLYATALASSATVAVASKFADKMDVMLVVVSSVSACALAVQAVLVP
jgi:hypothetical protein